MKTYFAIVALVILELAALYNGIDGALFSLVVAAIAGLGGYELAAKRKGGIK